MEQRPKRKNLRIAGYDYAASGVYFVTVCTMPRQPLFWTKTEIPPSPEANIPLSAIGQMVQEGIERIASVYQTVRVDKYCIMPDHIHLLLSVEETEDAKVSVSRMIQHLKGAVTKQIGKSIWQKSFLDRVIRNETGYQQAWQYIENNPLKYVLQKTCQD